MPTSFAQERLCKLQDALPGIPFFNVLYALRISSRCEAAVLERSINEIVRRHEILRTTFAIKDGRYVQVIAPRLSVVLACKSLAGLPRRRKETVAHKFIQKEALHSFDLTKGPLIRARLIHLAQREHLLLISLHQIVCDGWSLGILVEELTALYDALSTGRQPSLPPLPIQYADFAQWQRRWELHPLMLAQLAYWRVQLRDLLPSMQLAGAVPGGRVEKLCTARRAWGIPARLGNAVRRFGHENGATLFMALAAGLNILLHRYLDQDDVRVATNVANRNRPGTAGLIGPLVNTVILRTSLAGDPAPREVLRRVRETTLAAFANQDFPIEAIARMLQRERGLNPAALANVMIILQNAALRPQAASARGLTVEEAAPDAMLPLVTTAGFDVILTLHDGAHGLRGTCVYKPHLFAPSAIDRLLRDFQQVIERMVMHPERPVSAIHVLPIEQTLHG